MLVRGCRSVLCWLAVGCEKQKRCFLGAVRDLAKNLSSRPKPQNFQISYGHYQIYDSLKKPVLPEETIASSSPAPITPEEIPDIIRGGVFSDDNNELIYGAFKGRTPEARDVVIGHLTLERIETMNPGFIGVISESLHVGSCWCHSRLRRSPITCPLLSLWVQPRHVRIVSPPVSGMSLKLQSAFRLCVLIPFACSFMPS